MVIGIVLLVIGLVLGAIGIALIMTLPKDKDDDDLPKSGGSGIPADSITTASIVSTVASII
jgi:xanthine/uracil permease